MEEAQECVVVGRGDGISITGQLAEGAGDMVKKTRSEGVEGCSEGYEDVFRSLLTQDMGTSCYKPPLLAHTSTSSPVLHKPRKTFGAYETFEEPNRRPGDEEKRAGKED